MKNSINTNLFFKYFKNIYEHFKTILKIFPYPYHFFIVVLLLYLLKITVLREKGFSVYNIIKI